MPNTPSTHALLARGSACAAGCVVDFQSTLPRVPIHPPRVPIHPPYTRQTRFVADIGLETVRFFLENRLGPAQVEF